MNSITKSLRSQPDSAVQQNIFDFVQGEKKKITFHSGKWITPRYIGERVGCMLFSQHMYACTYVKMLTTHVCSTIHR